MRKLPTLIFGVALGFVLAHFVNQNPKGHAFFEAVNAIVAELRNALVEGYREAE